MNKLADFYEKARQSVQQLEGFVSQYNLSGILKADHVSYKCDSSERFQDVLRIFTGDVKNYRWLHMEPISGRNTAVIRLSSPIETKIGNISLLELSDQKPDKSQENGFDHIEVYPTSTTYEVLVANLESRDVQIREIRRPHHTTHDIRLESGFIIRLTREPLAEKIRNEQMT